MAGTIIIAGYLFNAFVVGHRYTGLRGGDAGCHDYNPRRFVRSPYCKSENRSYEHEKVKRFAVETPTGVAMSLASLDEPIFFRQKLHGQAPLFLDNI
jgi:hypothetical protein